VQVLLSALRARDETAFVMLVERYQAMMVRLARLFVKDAAVAEEVVQETWVRVLHGLDRFEARSSLKRWISVIVVNRAKNERASRAAERSVFGVVACRRCGAGGAGAVTKATLL
jgi:RNA polymerase sigma-70 factor (ECF subfamily)